MRDPPSVSGLPMPQLVRFSVKSATGHMNVPTT
jgi:hypothetical protein